jgi:hypothetical protein
VRQEIGRKQLDGLLFIHSATMRSCWFASRRLGSLSSSRRSRRLGGRCD